jgi:hypothetical protein
MHLITRPLKKSVHRGLTIEYTLIAILIASMAFQTLVVVGVKAV